MQEYEQIFEWYKATRNSHTGVASVRSAFSELQKGSTVVDLGCGTGQPLVMCLLEMGMHVVGVDSSEQMISEFKKICPVAEAVLCDISKYTFPAQNISGVLSWGCIFHLTPRVQVQVINKVFNAVKSGGRFLFTSSKDQDRQSGEMNGVCFHYYSLGSAKYNELAENAGWQLIREGEDEADNYQYLFQKL